MSPLAPPTPSLPRAAAWMAGWLTLMLVIAVAGRQAMRELNLFQIMEMRSLLGVCMLAPWLWWQGGLGTVRTQRLGEHVLRNSVHYAAQYGWFAALALIPMAQVVAIEFTMPIWGAVLAVVWLRERMTVRKVAAIALGLAGVLAIVRPAADGLNLGQGIALAAAVGFAVSVTMVKALTRTESAFTVVFWMLLVQALIGLLPALWVWRWPGAQTWAWVVLVAFCGTFSHLCMAQALRHAEATVVVPMDFLRVPLAAALGWAVYGEVLDAYTALGVGLILCANALNLGLAPKRMRTEA